MGRKKKKGRPPQGSAPQGRPVKGFRPGKEPPHLRKRQAQAQLGEDASWAQRQAVDLVAERSPAEVRAMMNRWVRALLAVVVVLAVGGAFLYAWATWAGAALHVLAVAAGFLWHRMRRQRDQLVKMAESFGRQ